MYSVSMARNNFYRTLPHNNGPPLFYKFGLLLVLREQSVFALSYTAGAKRLL